MFLFYLLGVALSLHWIFCQFWLCEEASVSTYAAILVLVLIGLLFIHTVCDWTNMVITIKQTSATRVLSFLFDFSP